MRLFLLADAAAPHTRRWAKWFALKGHEVHLISFNSESLMDYEPVTVHFVWKSKGISSLVPRIFKMISIILQIRKIMKKFPPDIIHAHSAGGYAWAAKLIGFKPYVITPWGTDLMIDINNSKINYWLTSKSLLTADLVTTDGFHFLPILEGLGVKKNRIYLHTFGTNVNHFCPSNNQSERQILGLDSECPVVISTRTLNPVHDVETFIRAIPLTHKGAPSAKFIIVGDGVERARFEELVCELGVEQITTFVGMVEEGRMLRLLQASNIYVSTSKMDAGLAASTAEAMAVGLPVVQTKNSDNEYWTPHGIGGLLVPNEDPIAVADALINLIKDQTLRSSMGKHNRSKVIKEYNTDVEMSRIEDQYGLLLDRNFDISIPA